MCIGELEVLLRKIKYDKGTDTLTYDRMSRFLYMAEADEISGKPVSFITDEENNVRIAAMREGTVVTIYV